LFNSGQFTFKSGTVAAVAQFTIGPYAPVNCYKHLCYDIQMNWNDNSHYNAVFIILMNGHGYG